MPHRSAAVLALLALAACGPFTEIEGRDDSTLQPTLRLRLDQLDRATRPVSPAASEPEIFAELDLSGTSGSFTTKRAPNVRGDFALYEGALLVGASYARGEPFGFEVFSGLGYTRVDLDLSDTLRSEPHDRERGGVLIGGKVAVELAPSLALYTRARTLFSLPGTFFESTSSQVELGLRYDVSRRAGVFAGWRRLHFRDKDVDFTTPVGGFGRVDTIDIEARGLLVGLELRF